MDTAQYLVDGSTPFILSDRCTAHVDTFANKQAGQEFLAQNITKLDRLQSRFAADGRSALLVIIQGMDASGKDGVVRNVFSGMNQSGVDVRNFKAPTSDELAHDYLWRIHKALPQRGTIGVFNRSHYEDVLIGKVRKLYEDQNILKRCKKPNTIEKRYRQIVEFERYLWENAIIPVKFMLNISRVEQARRFLSRIDDPTKNWKFSSADFDDRVYWDAYQHAYEECINATATTRSPWYVIPADNKWYTRAVVSQIVLEKMKALKPKYPTMSQETLDQLAVYREHLMQDDLNTFGCALTGGPS